MGYNLDERSQKFSYISEQKWIQRLKGELFNPSTDPIVKNNWPVKGNKCKNTPRSLIKYRVILFGV